MDGSILFADEPLTSPMDRAQRAQVIVSNIPSNAISAALSPIERQSNDAIRARQIQVQKNTHHAEDVEELDDAGVDSIRDQSPGKKDQRGRQEGGDHPLEEKVEIESLKTAPQAHAPHAATGGTATGGRAYLDISA
jgi:hypothetical protein